MIVCTSHLILESHTGLYVLLRLLRWYSIYLHVSGRHLQLAPHTSSVYILQHYLWPYYSCTCTYASQHFLNNFYFNLSLYRNHTVLPKITSNTVEWLYPHVYTITVQSSKSSWCVILMSSNKSETHWPESSVSMAPAKCIYHLHVRIMVPIIEHLPCTWHEFLHTCIAHIILYTCTIYRLFRRTKHKSLIMYFYYQSPYYDILHVLH